MPKRRFLPTPPATTSTDVSVTRPDVVPARREPSWVRHQREQEIAAAQGGMLLQQMEAHLGGILSQVKAPPLNDVLYSGARIIPGAGFDVMEWPTRWSSAMISNTSPSLLTLGTSASSGSASTGAGVTHIPPGSFRVWNGRGDGVRVYGAPGTIYDLAIYARPRQPHAGLCGLSQGATLIPAGTTASATTTFAGAGLAHIAAVLNVSAIAGGEAVQLTLNGVTLNGYVYPLLVGLAVTSLGSTPYRIGPGLTPSPNAVANDLVPAEIEAVATISGAGTVTYGVDLVTG
ncbi:MAG: hypothetical protein ABSF84_02760 [Acidimicrobiales bacterium]|jgi:hypothetical protein